MHRVLEMQMMTEIALFPQNLEGKDDDMCGSFLHMTPLQVRYMSICVRRFDPEVPMRRTEAQWLVGDEMGDDGACGDAFLHINVKLCILSNFVS